MLFRLGAYNVYLVLSKQQSRMVLEILAMKESTPRRSLGSTDRPAIASTTRARRAAKEGSGMSSQR